MKRSNYLVVLIAFFFWQCGSDDPTPKAEASVTLNQVQLNSDETYLVTSDPMGSISFSQEDSIVTMTIDLINFAPNSVHAVHIHEGTCEMPGLHWNMGVPHTEKFCNTRSLGIPWAKPLAGDVGNVSVGYDGSGSLTIKTDLWSIGTGLDNDVIGKVVVIHDAYEDFTEECDPNHDHKHFHNNPKVACGMVE